MLELIFLALLISHTLKFSQKQKRDEIICDILVHLFCEKPFMRLLRLKLSGLMVASMGLLPDT